MLKSFSFLTLFLFVMLGLQVQAQDPEYQINGSLGLGTNPDNDKKLDVDGDTQLRGDADLEGDLKFTNKEYNLEGLENLFFLNENKKMMTLGEENKTMDFVKDIYKLSCFEDPEGNVTPLWESITGIPGVMTLCSGARLGIGTTAPNAAAHINGATIVSTRLTVGANDLNSSHSLFVNGTSQLNGDVVIDLPSNAGPQGFSVLSDDVTLFSVSSGGALASRIESGQGNFWSAKNSLNANVYLLRANGSFKSYLQGGAPSAFEAIGEDGFEIFRLDADGSYKSKLSLSATRAISVYEPGENGHEIFRVDPNGNLFATKVTVEMTPFFPDYVFEDDYKLMPLNELKKYIEQNKRLPNMPSAKNVADNGADLGEMNRLLVEKVEELTLYVLQLSEQNTALQKQFDNLKVASGQGK